MRLLGRMGRVGLIGVLVTAGSVLVDPAGAHADSTTPAVHYAYTALPDGYTPQQITATDQVLLYVNTSEYGEAVWSQGAITNLAHADAPAGDRVERGSVYLNDSGSALSQTAYYGYSPVNGNQSKFDGAVVEHWAPGQYASAPTTTALPGTENDYNPHVGPLNDAGQYVVQDVAFPPAIYDAGGTNPRAPGVLHEIDGFGDTSYFGFNYGGTAEDPTYDYSVVDLATGTATPLDFTPQWISANGWIAGARYQSGVTTWVLRSPAGDESTLSGLVQLTGIDNDGDVAGLVGYHGDDAALEMFGTSTPTLVSSFLPADSAGTVPNVVMASNGDIAGTRYHPTADGTSSVYSPFFMKKQDDTVQGTVLQGTAPGTPVDPATPASDVSVTVSGTTADNVAYTATTTTGTAGTWGVHAPAGTYTVTFPTDTCVRDGATTCDNSAPAVVDADLDPMTVDALQLRAHLAVKVTADPKQTALKLDKTGAITPKTITVTVAVTNDGTQPVTDVAAASKLTVGYHDPTDVAVPTVPLRPKTGPLPKTIGTLAPGKSKSVTYTLSAEGDGNYDVTALVTGADPQDHTVKGVGTTQVLIGTPILVEKTNMGQHVASRGTKLDVAGTNFSIHLQFQNVSYTKKIAVAPFFCTPGGNASDGHVQDYDKPIQHLPPQTETLSGAFELAPREKADLACVLRTSTIPADTLVNEKSKGGGTRATAWVPTPEAWFVKDGVKGKQLGDTDVFVDGDRTFTVSLDDSDLRAEPEAETVAGDAYYFSVGAVHGLWNVTGGAVSGLFRTLPTLVASGIEHVPTGLISYVGMEMELFNAVKDDPAKLALFLNPLTNTSLAMYEHAPELIGDVAEFKAKITKDVLDAYTKTWNDWYGGNREQALKDFGQEFVERSADVALAVAPGLLARNPQVLSAFVSQKSRLYAQVSEKLAQYQPKLVSAIEATKVLASALKPGYEMSNLYLRKFFGLSDAQSQFLRTFAKEYKLLIVVRSRATESIAWIERHGAVLKPEMIKIKNVNELDPFLGYSESDVGRVVIKTNLPTPVEVEKTLRGRGFAPGDAQWDAVLKRLAQRTEELTNTDDGFLHNLQNIAKNKKVKLKFNLAGNVVDPAAVSAEPTTYGFRLAKSPGRAGELIPEFEVNGKWRSVTGDVDFLQLTHANGTPLTDAERVVIYQKISKSIIGFMHGESATWAKSAGVFDFEKKYQEFERTGIVAQFAPDGESRAVKFVRELSNFSSKTDYRINWDGGYLLPQGPAVP